jgi:hypothetical protein
VVSQQENARSGWAAISATSTGRREVEFVVPADTRDRIEPSTVEDRSLTPHIARSDDRHGDPAVVLRGQRNAGEVR